MPSESRTKPKPGVTKETPTPTTGDLFGPEHLPLSLDGSIDEQALTLFKALLYNRPDEREVLSNAISIWDVLPRFAGERLNQEEVLPDTFECEFELGGERCKMVLTPGTSYRMRSEPGLNTPTVEAGSSERRYPGGREQAVEQALIKIACDQAESMELEGGETVYQVSFSIKHLQDVLATFGSKYKHTQIREALDILSTSIMTIYDRRGIHIRRRPMLPGFDCISPDGKATKNPQAQWIAQLHPIVASSIRNAAYRQFNLSQFQGRKSYSAYLLKQIVLHATNISPSIPHRVVYSELRQLTSGLNYKRPRDGIDYLEREIKRMVESGCLTHYQREDRRAQQRGAGRPAIADATFHLYPGKTLIADIMAASKRQELTEQQLKLPRTKRSDRQPKITAKAEITDKD